ncbi:hypothetical protein DPX39_100101700 [Trypanosoma brucei equiperdum]|uniref:Uncharacterized protein n=1 Tax=Trypanosoma brucei equiperdum TaxID=630700 RepID=A0A3L6KXF6_9TRYP|nr:hypothetical protein DPX39_100101700 [Trypanosoma brucei equiperdum]
MKKGNRRGRYRKRRSSRSPLFWVALAALVLLTLSTGLNVWLAVEYASKKKVETNLELAEKACGL